MKLFLLFLLSLVTLKIVGVITYSWLMILSPFLIFVTLFLVAVFIMCSKVSLTNYGVAEFQLDGYEKYLRSNYKDVCSSKYFVYSRLASLAFVVIVTVCNLAGFSSIDWYFVFLVPVTTYILTSFAVLFFLLSLLKTKK